MTLNDTIYKRLSVRAYTGESVSQEIIEKINEFMASAKPLYPDIRVHYEIVPRTEIKCILPWLPPEIISIYSEDTPKAAVNVGFIFQQLDLYLQSIGIGTCWLGMGKPGEGAKKKSEDGLKFQIMLAFGYPKSDGMRNGKEDFNRRAPEDIADTADGKLEPARLAPSAVNTQPWYFVHSENVIHTYRRLGFFMSKTLGNMNVIDMGIALAHMYVANPEHFEFFKAEDAEQLKGCEYIGSFRI